MSMKLSSADATKLRFAVGSRVECRLGDEWKAGTVCLHFFTQSTFPAGTCVPYQVAGGEEGTSGRRNRTPERRTEGKEGEDTRNGVGGECVYLLATEATSTT